MDLLNKLTIKSLKLNKKRTIVTIIGIMLSVALITAVATMYSSAIKALINFETYHNGNFHIAFYDVNEKEIYKIEKNKGVEELYLTSNIGYAKLNNSKNEYKPYAYIKAFTNDALENLSIKLIDGRLPKDENEIVIPNHLKTNGRIDLKIGDEITLDVGKRINEEQAELNQYNPFIKEVKEEIVETTTKTYKIVGIIERPAYNIENYEAPGYTFITYLDKERINGYVDVYAKFNKYGSKNYLNVAANILEVDEEIFVKGYTHNFTESEKKELGIVFKEIWKMYPKKQNVTGARKNSINMVVKKGVSVLTLKNAVKNYAKYVEDNKIEPTYIILGSNFFGRSERYAEFTDEAMGNNKETTLSEVEENQVKTSFERFWQAYPKKEGKELAYKNFLHIYINKENTLEELIRSAEKYASDCFVKHKENQFIKKASSFLDLEIRPYRDFIDFTNTPSMNVAPTTDYAIPVVNQPVYDAPIVSTQEFKNEENTPIENAPFEISSIVPQPLEDDDEDEEDDYSSVENQEPNKEAPVSSQTFVANDEDINDEETPW